MIRVTPADEPKGFQTSVREPGLRALAEMVGEVPRFPRKKGKAFAKRAARREEIPAEKMPPYWTEALDNLMQAYNRICAYACFRIHPVTGSRSVDHMAPKSRQWDRAYEWSNYRLACSMMNARKQDFGDVLDPFEVQDGWFQLELVGFQALPAPDLDPATRTQVEDTISRLGLNGREFRDARERDVTNYENDGRFDVLMEESPFVARELRRQGRLREGDG